VGREGECPRRHEDEKAALHRYHENSSFRLTPDRTLESTLSMLLLWEKAERPDMLATIPCDRESHGIE